MATPKILVTAFEPFGTWKTNSSALCLKLLKENLDFSALGIKSYIYPVSWEGAKAKILKDLKGKYDYLIHLGQNEQAKYVTLESKAYNEANNMADMDGKRLKGKIDPRGADAYRSMVDLSGMGHLLHDKGYPYVMSDDPGRFLCNFVYYLSMQGCANAGRGKCAFIHIPLDPSQTAGTRLRNPTYDIAKSTAAVSLVLRKIAKG